MIFLLMSLAYIFISKGRFSISKYLFFLLAVSSFSAILVGKQHDWIDDIPFVIYAAPLLFILFNSYKRYADVKFIDCSSSEKTLSVLVKVFSIPVAVSWFICAFITFLSFNLLSSGVYDADEYKAGLYINIITQYFPAIVVNLITYIAALGYFYLSMHFYYLLRGNIKMSLLTLWLSSILIIQGLLSLSRSSTGNYILVYLGCMILLYPSFPKRLRKIYIRSIVILGVVVGSMMMTVTNSKFSEHYSLASGENAVLDASENSSLFSIFDYFGQWQDSSPKIRADFKTGDEFWGLYSVFYIRKIYADFNGGNDKLVKYVDDKNRRIYGNNVIYFRDITTSLVMDFGYVGAIFFILIFAAIVRGTSPKRHVLTIKNLFLLPVFLPIGVNFYCGNAFGNVMLGYGLIINWLIGAFISRSPKKTKIQ